MKLKHIFFKKKIYLNYFLLDFVLYIFVKTAEKLIIIFFKINEIKVISMVCEVKLITKMID